MTLATVSRYDPAQIEATNAHAVVVGASMAGLVAARVLADRFESVTVVERDPLPDAAVARQSVPQANHAHVMHEAGRATLEDLFPAYGEELISAGALLIDLAGDFAFYDEGGFLATGPTRLPMYTASRPLFEQVARRCVDELDGVALRGRCQYLDYLADERSGAVTGVTVRNERGAEEAVRGELVVDATGRTSRTPDWLAEHGYAAPATDEVHIDLAYSTLLLERPPDERETALVMPDPPRTRGAGVFPIEDDRWLMTLSGVHGDHPPTDEAGFADFAASLPIPTFERLLETHAVVSDGVSHYPFPSTRRHRYERLDRFPTGLLVIGDAIASFNPIYGQGMSVAALEALHLHHALSAGHGDGLADRYFGRIEQVIDDAWNLAVGADFQFPETTGPKPAGTDLLNRYLSRLTRRAHADGVLAEAFTRVIIMERRPISLFRPSVVWRVLRPAR